MIKGGREQAFRLSEVSQTVSPPAIWRSSPLLAAWQLRCGSSGCTAHLAPFRFSPSPSFVPQYHPLYHLFPSLLSSLAGSSLLIKSQALSPTQ